MTVEAFNGWSLAVGVALCLALGFIVVSSVCFSHLRKHTIAWASFWFACLGAFLMTRPKWSKVALRLVTTKHDGQAAGIESKFAAMRCK
jgi:hypothetical protein